MSYKYTDRRVLKELLKSNPDFTAGIVQSMNSLIKWRETESQHPATTLLAFKNSDDFSQFTGLMQTLGIDTRDEMTYKSTFTNGEVRITLDSPAIAKLASIGIIDSIDGQRWNAAMPIILRDGGDITSKDEMFGMEHDGDAYALSMVSGYSVKAHLLAEQLNENNALREKGYTFYARLIPSSGAFGGQDVKVEALFTTVEQVVECAKTLKELGYHVKEPSLGRIAGREIVVGAGIA